MFLVPLIIIAVVLLAVWAASGQPGRSTDTPREIARRRLATGEISVEEFERLEAHLAGGGGPRASAPALAPILAVVGVILMVATAISLAAWASWSGDWDWGWGHMGRMMGSGGTDSSTDAPLAGTSSETVVIEDFTYTPGNLQVPAGAKVTWTNRDSAPHSATANDGSWDTALLRQGQSSTLVFDRPGTYGYYCSVHPAMKAKLVVR